MMKSLQVIENKDFIGRAHEKKLLTEIISQDKAAILVVYGRRRVGKTELVEQCYRCYGLLKFEGLEGFDEKRQREEVIRQLAKYVDEPLLANLNLATWVEVFELISKFTNKGRWTVYFEEVQWLANYKDAFVSELKYVWDNFFRHNEKLKLVLCGSSPSFMINQVMLSKALYNRSTHELHLPPLSLHEAKLLLKNKSLREVMDAYLTLGGIPEYLNQIKKEASIFVGICKKSFAPEGYFFKEHKRIFVSSLSSNKHYKKIINFLSQRKYANRTDIGKFLDIKSGGQMTTLLDDLAISGFIESYSPYNKNNDGRVKRYCIKDNYLNFYFKFIAPIANEIQNGDYNHDPIKALDSNSYLKWLGFSFERFCRHNHQIIAKILEFKGVRYKYGAYFSRGTEKDFPGFQIDLLFFRRDHVVTVCEIKYLQGKAGTELIQSFEDKLALMEIPSRYSIQKILITTEGATDALISRAYFDSIITLQDFFEVS